jgi:hypothetical protein
MASRNGKFAAFRHKDGRKHSCHKKARHSGQHHSAAGLSWGGLGLAAAKTGTPCGKDCP